MNQALMGSALTLLLGQGMLASGCERDKPFAGSVATDDSRQEPARVDAGDGASDSGARRDAGSCDRLPTPSRPQATLEAAVYTHPEPSGPYAVGTHIEWFWDEARPEPSTPEDDDVRGVAVQFFYPTETDDGEFGPLMDDRVSEILTAVRGFPLDFHRYVETRSRFDVPLRGAADATGWPILIYSHGQSTFRQENTLVFEEFASQGWVVVAVTHPFSSAAVVRPDGSVATTTNVPTLPLDPTPDDRFEQIQGNHALLTGTWAKDVSFVLDELERRTADDCSWLAHRLDLTRIGVWGYSFGGAAAHHVCVTDPRCTAGANFDGRLHGDPTLPLERPFLMIRTDQGSSLRDWDVTRNGATEPTYSAWIEGATHGNFTMNGVMAEALLGVPSSRLGFGSISAERAHEILLDMLMAFMKQHVLGDEQALLEGPSPYPEVIFERTTSGETAATTAIFGAVAEKVGSDVRSTEYEVVVEPPSFDVTRWDKLFHIAEVPAGQALTLRFTREGFVPSLRHLLADPYFEHLGTEALLTPEELARLADTAGVELMEGRGHAWLQATSYYREKAVVAAGDIEFTASADESARYLSGDLTIDPELEATVVGVGGAWIFNLQPGSHRVSASTGRGTCREAYRASGPSDSADLVVEADSVSTASFSCE